MTPKETQLAFYASNRRIAKLEAELKRMRRNNTRMHKELRSVVPANWCDPLLTGNDAIAIPAYCSDIERLLSIIKVRIDTACARAERAKGKG